MLTPLILAVFPQIQAPPQAPQQSSPACQVGVIDQSQPHTCINASSVPTPGMLLPLGPFFWVNSFGQVGIGTQSPETKLHVAGDVKVDGGLTVGNDALVGGVGDWSYASDISHYIDQFPGIYSLGLNSIITYDPPHHLTGIDTGWLWSQVFRAQIPSGNDKDVDALYGATSYTYPSGTGSVGYCLGTGAVAQSTAGHVMDQTGGAFTSLGDNSTTLDFNTWIYALGGHDGVGGSIQNDYGVYIDSPWNASPLQNHYGLYLADQDFGVDDSYAIYAAGGTTYLAGDLGVGVTVPAAKLDVNGDFAASGTKSFRQVHPEDPTREIWFACLEGNEAGTYFRGSSQLVNGRAVIAVPTDFALVTEPEGLTVQVTPMGNARVWVEHKGLDHIIVRGDADVEFDLLVNGVRAGFADFQTMRQAPVDESGKERGRVGRFPVRESER